MLYLFFGDNKLTKSRVTQNSKFTGIYKGQNKLGSKKYKHANKTCHRQDGKGKPYLKDKT